MTGSARHIAAIVLSSILVAATLLALPASRGAGQQLPEPAVRCDLVAAYGTVVVVPGGQELDVRDDNRAELLDGIRLCVETILDQNTLAAYRQADAAIDHPVETDGDRADRSLIRVEIAALLSKDVSVQRQRAVARRVAGGVAALTLAIERQRAETALISSGWKAAEAKSGPRYDAAGYVNACRNAGVPVPGSLAEDDWSDPVDLDSETGRYLILQDKTDASVWTYKDPAGGYCVTLRRQDPETADAAPMIGTICSNADETQACFFDNLVADASGERRLSLEEYSSTGLSSLLHPMDGDDGCNTCHIGANPFMVDPKTMLGRAIAKVYGPKQGGEHFAFAGLDAIAGGWSNLGLIEGNGCMQCHDLPDIPKGDRFCTAIIQKAANTTMPPGYWDNKPIESRKPLWPGADGCFDRRLADLDEDFDRAAIFESLRRIKSICSGETTPVCSNADGMADAD